MTSEMKNDLIVEQKEESTEPHIAEEVVDCVLRNDLETTGAGSPSENMLIFSDGLALIKAFMCQTIKRPPITIAPVFNQKWQIWYWKRNGRHHSQSKDWPDFLQQKSSFTTKEEFWRSYSELNGYEFGLLSSHFDYCVFKEGIQPMWEDSANRYGGRWILEFPRKNHWKHMSYLDDIWLKVLLAITGNDESFKPYVPEICGVVLMIRYDVNKIAIWTKNSFNTLINLRIGEVLKASTGFVGKMYYVSHESTVKKIVVKKEHRIRFQSSE